MDSPAVRSAKGHVEWLSACVEEQSRRLEAGTHPLSESETRSLLAYYEGRLEEWRRALERAEREAADAAKAPHQPHTA